MFDILIPVPQNGTLLRSIIIVDIKMIASFDGISALSCLQFPVLRTSESVAVSQWAVVCLFVVACTFVQLDMPLFLFFLSPVFFILHESLNE